MKVAVTLAKKMLAPLGITTAEVSIDARSQNKIHGLGTTTLITSNKETNEIMKIVQTLRDSNILLKGVTKTLKNEIKGRKVGFLRMLLDTLRASLLGNMFARKGMLRAGYGNKEGKGIVRAGYGNKMDF